MDTQAQANLPTANDILYEGTDSGAYIYVPISSSVDPANPNSGPMQELIRKYGDKNIAGATRTDVESELFVNKALPDAPYFRIHVDKGALPRLNEELQSLGAGAYDKGQIPGIFTRIADKFRAPENQSPLPPRHPGVGR